VLGIEPYKVAMNWSKEEVKMANVPGNVERAHLSLNRRI
jgi:hypothetical protein